MNEDMQPKSFSASPIGLIDLVLKGRERLRNTTKIESLSSILLLSASSQASILGSSGMLRRLKALPDLKRSLMRKSCY